MEFKYTLGGITVITFSFEVIIQCKQTLLALLYKVRNVLLL